MSNGGIIGVINTPTTSVASATTDVVASANTTEIDRELYDPE